MPTWNCCSHLKHGMYCEVLLHISRQHHLYDLFPQILLLKNGSMISWGWRIGWSVTSQVSYMGQDHFAPFQEIRPHPSHLDFRQYFGHEIIL